MKFLVTHKEYEQFLQQYQTEKEMLESRIYELEEEKRRLESELAELRRTLKTLLEHPVIMEILSMVAG